MHDFLVSMEVSLNAGQLPGRVVGAKVVDARRIFDILEVNRQVITALPFEGFPEEVIAKDRLLNLMDSLLSNYSGYIKAVLSGRVKDFDDWIIKDWKLPILVRPVLDSEMNYHEAIIAVHTISKYEQMWNKSYEKGTEYDRGYLRQLMRQKRQREEDANLAELTRDILHEYRSSTLDAPAQAPTALGSSAEEAELDRMVRAAWGGFP